MARPIPVRRVLRHHLMPHRPLRRKAHGAAPRPARTSDLVLALLGVALLGGLALAAAFALAAGAPAP